MTPRTITPESAQSSTAHPYSLADVALPDSATPGGILVSGRYSSGKTLALKDLAHQVLKRSWPSQRKCVFYDQIGEYYQAFFREGRDLIYNPYVQGSVDWSVLGDLDELTDTDALSRVIVPPNLIGVGDQALIVDAAQEAVSEGLARLIGKAGSGLGDLVPVVAGFSPWEMTRICRASMTRHRSEGRARDLQISICTYLECCLPALTASGTGTWSLKSFLETSSDARLFMLARDSGSQNPHAMLFRVLIHVAMDLIERRNEPTSVDRYWLFVDPMDYLRDISFCKRIRAMSAFGVTTVGSVANPESLVRHMGEEATAGALSCFDTRLMLRAYPDDPAVEAQTSKVVAARLRPQAQEPAIGVHMPKALTAHRASDVTSPPAVDSEGRFTGWICWPGDGSRECAAPVDFRPWSAGGFDNPRVRHLMGNRPIPGVSERFLIRPNAPQVDRDG